MSPAFFSNPTVLDPSTCADGPWPDGPRIGSSTPRAFCITVTKPSSGSMARFPFDVVATATRPPSSYAPAAPPQATSTRRASAATFVKLSTYRR